MDQQMNNKTRAYTIFELLVAKLTSARFIVTIFVIWTLCDTVKICLNMALQATANKETFSMIKDIVMFMLGAFVTTVTAVVTAYFNRADRVGKPDDSNGSDPTK